jgi:hypothetical protein
MQRVATRLLLIGAGVLAARALAPKLHARMLAACEQMFEEMPESFPPKRMLHGIEEIQANSSRTVELLEERKHTTELERIEETALS